MVNSRVYRVYSESTKKKSLFKSQLIRNKWTRKLVRVSELTREFDNFGYEMRSDSHKDENSPLPIFFSIIKQNFQF